MFKKNPQTRPQSVILLTHLDSNVNLFSARKPLQFENHRLDHCFQIRLHYPWSFDI